MESDIRMNTLQKSQKTDLMPLNANILCAASVVGRKEREGPLGDHFDYVEPSDRFGQDSWEKAESEMQRMALAAALGKAHMTETDVGILLAGDLLNQCTGSAYGLLSYDIPYIGLYGACSTSAEGLLLAGMLTSAGYVSCAGVVTSSHNAAAERQFRTPLEYGGQRPPSAQWTVTGAGAFLVTSNRTAGCDGDTCTLRPPFTPLAHMTVGMPGIVLDRGVTDANNMGAAMAPAAESTLCRYFEASGTVPSDYDLIVTGDLGWEGSRILCDLMDTHTLDGVSLSIRERHNDCGCMMFSRNTQDTHSGGSGCGCSATVLASYLLPRLQSGQIRRMLYLATGALLSPDSIKQGQSIPGVAHLICMETPGQGSGQMHL